VRESGKDVVRERAERVMETQRVMSALERVAIKNLVVPAMENAESAATTEPLSRGERSTRGSVMPSRPKRPEDRFTREEDEKIRAWVARHGPRDWVALARELECRRTAGQLRARYTDVLIETRTTSSWSPAEDAALLTVHRRLGNHWAAIARELNCGRVPNDIKNRYRLLLRRAARRASH